MLRQKESKHLKSETKRSFHFIRIFLLASILLLTSSQYLLAQYNIDSIRGLSYEEFKTYFRKNHIDTVKDLIYANAFLEKAKKEKDTIEMAGAYLLLSNVSPFNIGLKYADSSIFVSKNFTNNKKYPASGYVYKGIYYSELGEWQKAVEAYVKAHRLAKESGNDDLLAIVKVNIGIIKSDLGEKHEAVIIFKDFINFVESSKLPTKNSLYTKGLFSLAIAYTNVQKYDSAILIAKKGQEIALKDGYVDHYAKFLNIYGINLYHKKNYIGAINSIQEALNVHDLKKNIPYSNLYLGKSNLALGDTLLALDFFLKVDSYLKNCNYIKEELLEAYSPIIDYYKNKKNYSLQLFYTNQLLRYDSIYDSNKRIVSKDIEKKYDIPQLISSKEELIDKLSKEKNNTVRKNYILLVFLLLLIILTFYFSLRYRKNKRRFNKLFKHLIEQETIEREGTDNKDVIFESQSENKTRLNIDNELINTVLIKLQEFEKSKRFTNNSYTLGKLAKELKTNNTYLSKIINELKGQNFSNYLKDLRIEYAISCLKKNPKFRTYTIQAIAEEVGFNKAQSFSTAFNKKTGLYPSYFIKQLEKMEIGTE